MSDIAQRLKTLRDSLGLTQTDFAKIIGFSQGNVGDWERGIKKPTIPALLAISNEFNVSIDWLVKGETPSYSSMIDFNDELKDISERIKELRKGANLSQANFAKKIGFSQGNVGDWERGISKPTIPALIAISNEFHVSIDLLVKGESKIKTIDDSNICMSIGKRIKQLRDKDNLTMKELAVEIGCAPGQISDWEKDKKQPSAGSIISLSNFFNVSTDWILKGEDPFFNAKIDTQYQKGESLSELEEELLSLFRGIDDESGKRDLLLVFKGAAMMVLHQNKKTTSSILKNDENAATREDTA